MSKFTTAVKLLDAIAATSAGTSNNYVDVSARKQLSVQLAAGSENAVFELQISDDGINFVTYNRLTSNVTNTNSQSDIGVGSASVTANTSAIYFIRHGDHFRYCRGSATLVGTDSAFTATLVAVD